MTSNTGNKSKKKHLRKFQYLNKTGARAQRKEFMDTGYVKGVVNEFGEQVIRPLNKEEVEFLNSFYKESVHGTFNTDAESKLLFKEAKRLTRLSKNIDFFQENGFHPTDVQDAISRFEEKSKSLGNIFYKFFDQREINSDDWKRRQDIQNNCIEDVQLESFEDLQYMAEVEDYDDTVIEDLITESEE